MDSSLTPVAPAHLSRSQQHDRTGSTAEDDAARSGRVRNMLERSPFHGVTESLKRRIGASKDKYDDDREAARDFEKAHDKKIEAADPDTKGNTTIREVGEPGNQLVKHGGDSEPKPKTTFLTLPGEIHLMILRRLDLPDIIRLKGTCSKMHSLASPSELSILFGGKDVLKRELMRHCRTCLQRDLFNSRLIRAPVNDPKYPFANRCIDCAIRANDPKIRVGEKVSLADFAEVWVCRWCGWPIVEGAAYGDEQFHRTCHKRYNDVVFAFCILGWIQLGLAVAAAALAWRYYRWDKLVFGPTLASFLLYWVCLMFVVFRGNRVRTYHWTFVLELTILGLWIAPVYFVGTQVAGLPSGETTPKRTVACIVMFALNIWFRFLNVLGNFVLLCRYDLTLAKRPNAPLWRRLFNPVAMILVFWTYPQALQQKYPRRNRVQGPRAV